MTTQTQSPQRGPESTQRRGRSWAWSAATPSRAPGTWLKPSKTAAQPGHQVSTTECDLSPQAELPSEALIELLTHKIVRYKKSITWSKVSWIQVRNLIKEELNDQTPTVVAGYWPVKTLIPLFWVQWTLSPSKTWGPKWGRALQTLPLSWLGVQSLITGSTARGKQDFIGSVRFRWCWHASTKLLLLHLKKTTTKKLGLESRHSGDLESVLSPWKNFVTFSVFHFSICSLWVCISSQVFIYSSWECTEDPQETGCVYMG